MRVYHYGQATIRSSEPAICGKRLGEHSTVRCTNDWVCRGCKRSGHKILDYQNVNADMTVSDTAFHATDLITNSEKSSTTAVAPVTDLGKDKNLSVAEAAKAAAASEFNIKKSNRKKAKSKAKNSNATALIKHYFTDSASAGTPCQRNKPQLVRSPPTPAEVLNTESKK